MARSARDNLNITLEITSTGGNVTANILKADDALGKLDRTTVQVAKSTDRATRETRQYNEQLKDTATVAGAAGSALKGLGLLFVAREAAQLGGALIDLSGAFEQIESTLTRATGTISGARGEMAFIRDEAERLGVNFQRTANDFATFAAATRETELAGEGAREVFTAIAEASTVARLSLDDTAGIFRAFNQIISDGTVQLEEINQIAERLPGTFALANRAVEDTGKTIRELTREGSLAADEFVLNFARAMREEFAPGVERATQSVGASFNRLTNALEEFGATLASSGMAEFVGDVAEALADLVGWVQQTLQGVGLLRDLFTDLPNSVEAAREEITRLESDLASLDESMRLGEADNSVLFARQQETLERLQEVRTQVRLLNATTERAAQTNRQFAQSTEEVSGALVEEYDAVAAIDAALDDAVATKQRNQEADERAIQSLNDQLTALELTGDELQRFRADMLLSVDATDEQQESARFLLAEIEKLQEANTQWADSISLVATGFNSLDDEWANTVGEVLNGTSRMIAQFQSINSLTSNWQSNLSNIGAGLGLVSTGIGVGSQVGGRGGGIGGGLVGGALAGSQLLGVPGAFLGAGLGALIGGFFGGGGGERDPRNQLFLRTLPFPGEAFSREPRGDFRISGQSAFGGFRFSGGSEISSEVIAQLRDVALAIGQLDDAIGENLDPAQIAAVTEALADFEFGGRAGEGLTAEEAFRQRFTTVFGAIDEELGKFFESVTGAADVGEMAAVADTLNTILGEGGVFSDVSGVMENVNVLMEEFAERGETITEVMARVGAELELIGRLGVEVAEPTTALAQAAGEFVDALGGLDAATGAVQRFDAVFSQTRTNLERTQGDLEATLADYEDTLGVDFTAGAEGLEDFAQAFNDVVDTLSPEELAAWVEAGLTLADLTDVMSALERQTEDTADNLDGLNETLSNTAELAAQRRQQLADFMAPLEQDLQDLIDNLSPLEQGIRDIERQADAWVARASALGANEDAIATIRQLEALRIQALIDAEEERLAQLDEQIALEQQLVEQRANEDAFAAAERELELMEAELATRQQLNNAIADSLDIQAAWARENESAYAALQRTQEALSAAREGFDGTLEGLQAIDAASGQWRSMALTVLREIENARATIEGTVGTSAEQLRLEGMTQAEQYEYFQRQANALRLELDDLTDPEEIAEVVSEINRLANEALGLADETQRAEVRERYVAFFDEVAQIARDRLDAAEQGVLETGDAFRDTVQPVLERAMGDFATSVERMRGIVEELARIVAQGDEAAKDQGQAALVQSQAAQRQFEAASIPVRVTVAAPPAVNEA